MKNRLQIKYHLSETLPTRSEAVEYIKKYFNENTSLISEPLVVFYNDMVSDIPNGITEQKRLETCNVILGIGKGGDGINLENNNDYFIIDFAEHTEKINQLELGDLYIKELINKINENLESLRNQVKENYSTIQYLLGVIGSGFNDESVFTNLQNLKSKIETEVERAQNAEHELSEEIINNNNNLCDEISYIRKDLNEHVNRLNLKDAELEGAQKNYIDDLNLVRGSILENKTAITTLESNLGQISHSVKLEFDDVDEKIKENKVTSSNKTIIVNPPTENGTDISVNVDNKTIVYDKTGKLSVDSDAILQYDGENAIVISEKIGNTRNIKLKIHPNDDILVNDDDGLYASLRLQWVKDGVETGLKDELQLVGKNNIIISRLDLSELVKDNILENVYLNTDDPLNPKLVFVFNANGDKEDIELPVKDIMKIYEAGNGLSLENDIFNVVVDENSEDFLSVSENGIKISGVNSAIIDAKNELRTQFTTSINNAIENLKKEGNAIKIAEAENESANMLIQTKKNFIEIENENDGVRSLAVRSIDTDSTILQKDIVVAGLDGQFGAGNYYNNQIIRAGTDIYTILENILCKELYPEKITKQIAEATVEMNDLTLTLNCSDDVVEVGTNVKLLVTKTNGVKLNTKDSIISGMDYGYSYNNNNTKYSEATSISKECKTNVNDNITTIKLDITNGFNGDGNSISTQTSMGYDYAQLTNVDLGYVTEGENKLVVNATGSSYTYTAERIPKIYYCSNLGKTNEDNYNVGVESVNGTTNKPTAKPTEGNVIGKYKYFIGYAQKYLYSEFESDDIRKLDVLSDYIEYNQSTVVLDDTTKKKSNGTSIIIACPETYKLSSITNGIGADIMDNFSSVGIVPVKTGKITTNYKVYVYPIKNNVAVEYKNIKIVKNN